MYPCVRLALTMIVLAATIACNRSTPQRQGSTPPAPAGPVKAAWITTKIQAQYFGDQNIKPWNIDVTTTSGGHVTLRGEVEDTGDRDSAVRIARETDGVTTVDDRLRVTEPPVATADRTVRRNQRARGELGDPRGEHPDLWITTRIQAKFYTDDEVRTGQIDVDTRAAVVTLRGAVDSIAARRQAVALARNTDGVRDVRNELQIDGSLAANDAKQQRSVADAFDDARIVTQIESKLFLDPSVKGRPIDVAVEDRVVTLRGVVGSEDEEQIAEEIAGQIDGVTGVRNELQIRAAMASG